MKLKLILSAAALLVAFVPSSAFAQTPDGSDINKAIPIYFGQIVTDIIDGSQKPIDVYKVTLARGQQVTVTAKSSSANPNWDLCLASPATTTIGGLQGSNCVNYLSTTLASDGYGKGALSFSYQVATAGTYYVIVQSFSTSNAFQLQINAAGTPIAVPNPASAGCLSGRVDYITYSLQLIAVGLPDELSIGGTKVSPSSIVKPPLYPEIAMRLENALRSKVNVEACYDSSGNIFQIKLVQP